MQGMTLMLDHCYQPIDVKTWQECMVDEANDKIRIIAEYADRVIHEGRSILMPMIAVFKHKIVPRKRAVKFSRDNIYARDKGKCQYCQERVPRDNITYDHVTPRARAGRTWWNNIVICCRECNQCKGQRTMSCGRATCTKCKGRRRPMAPKTAPVKPSSLPPRLDPRLMWRRGMPESWSMYMSKDERASDDYWHGELDHD